jgi:hypothetical protein
MYLFCTQCVQNIYIHSSGERRRREVTANAQDLGNPVVCLDDGIKVQIVACLADATAYHVCVLPQASYTMTSLRLEAVTVLGKDAMKYI